MRFINFLWAFLIAVLVTACGGGGGSAGTTPGGMGGSSAVIVSDLSFELSANQLPNTGTDSVTLTVTAVNASRNAVAGLPVTVSVDSGVFTPSSAATDTNGRYTGQITIGGNRANRVINATITANGVTRTAAVQVVGSQIAVTATPANPTPGQLVTLNILASNASSVGVAGAMITLNGGAIGSQPRTVTTDSIGSAVVTFNAPTAAGSFPLTISGLGVMRSQDILVNPSVGIPTNLPISSASLTAQLTSIPPNAANSTINRSRLSARFLNQMNTGVQNLRVRFELASPTLGTGEAISTGSFTVLTDANGSAEADYISGLRTSPTNGVILKACYSQTDFLSSSDCPQFVTTNLTVASQPLSITISNNNTLQSGLGGIAYIQQFLVQVSDSAGAAVRDAVVSTSVNITHFGKGVFALPIDYQRFRSVPPTAADIYGPTFPSTDVPTATQRVWCVNEDTNRNGSVDTLPSPEDFNGNGRLEPRQAEVIVSFVSGNRTDGNGQMLIQVSYGQNVGSWLAFSLRATTNVAGSEGRSERAFMTGILEDDVPNGSFRTPPYGTGSCTAPN